MVNYDTNNLHLAPYDWRLSYYNLEVRDSYFSKLKTTIEGFKYVSRDNHKCSEKVTLSTENEKENE